MENFYYIIGGLLIFIAVVGIIYSFREKEEETVANFTKGKEKYRAILKTGQNKRLKENWTYYRVGDNGYDIEITDLILLALIWENFLGEDGEYNLIEESVPSKDGFNEDNNETVVEEDIRETYIDSTYETTREEEIEAESVPSYETFDSRTIEEEKFGSEDTRKINDDFSSSSSSYSSSSSSSSSGSDYSSSSSSDSSSSFDD